MKKVLAVLAVSMLATSAFAGAGSASLQISVNGSATPSTCAVSNKARDLVVGMTPVTTNVLNKSIGQPITEGEKPFSIHLVDCPLNVTKVKDDSGKLVNFVADRVFVAFDSNSSNINKSTGNLINTFKVEEGGSGGLEVQISDADTNKKIPLQDAKNAVSSDKLLDTNGGGYTFNFKANYVASEPVSAGEFFSSIPFKVDYK